jgi:hypothetical protein
VRAKPTASPPPAGVTTTSVAPRTKRKRPAASLEWEVAGDLRAALLQELLQVVVLRLRDEAIERIEKIWCSSTCASMYALSKSKPADCGALQLGLGLGVVVGRDNLQCTAKL